MFEQTRKEMEEASASLDEQIRLLEVFQHLKAEERSLTHRANASKFFGQKFI